MENPNIPGRTHEDDLRDKYLIHAMEYWERFVANALTVADTDERRRHERKRS